MAQLAARRALKPNIYLWKENSKRGLTLQVAGLSPAAFFTFFLSSSLHEFVVHFLEFQSNNNLFAWHSKAFYGAFLRRINYRRIEMPEHHVMRGRSIKVMRRIPNPRCAGSSPVVLIHFSIFVIFKLLMSFLKSTLYS